MDACSFIKKIMKVYLSVLNKELTRFDINIGFEEFIAL